MNNTFSLQQIATTGDLNADLIMRQYKWNKMAKFMEIKSVNPKVKQSEIGKELKLSSSTLQRHRREINMLLPYGIPRSSNSHTRKQKIEHDLKVTSKEIKLTSNDVE